MTLFEIINNLESFDEGGTIYAISPWSAGSAAIVAKELEAGRSPKEAEQLGLDYFLEMCIAREFLEDWTGSLQSIPTPQERCERVIRYAVDDA
jgi:hypothetical protein